MDSPKISIAIVGGGASGTVLAIQLLKHCVQAARITLIEKHSNLLYRGVAYSSRLQYEPLNAQAGKMSIYPECPNDFIDFIQQHKSVDATSEDYVSRRWFGDYLDQQVKKAVALKSRFVDFEQLMNEVVDVSLQSNGKYSVHLTNSQLKDTDYVVLATGNDSPPSLVVNSKVPNGRCFDNPWFFDTQQIVPKSRVLIVGTGLTMVDIVGSVYTEDYDGDVVAISRKGLLPKVHMHQAKVTQLVLPKCNSLLEWLSFVRLTLKLFNKQGIHWSILINEIRPHISRIWQNFSPTEKALFLRKLKPIWELHRHRMPPISEVIIEALKAQHRLKIVSASIKNVIWLNEENRFEVIYINTNNQEAKLKVDYIVNCTGPSGDVSQSKQILFQNLLSKKWITPDEFKLGVLTDKQGMLIGKTNGIFAIGPLRKASEWESTAMAEICQQAEKLSKYLMSKLK
jgi:uncharacterized NAD(P)/FAD-binding protein YdhS